MKKVSAVYIYLCCIVCACSMFATNVAAQKQFSTIVIDAGHGGKDPGALGKKSKEKNIVLSVAQKFGKLVSDSLPGVKCVFTRNTDVFVPLDKRAEIANKNAADLFISIHANSSPSKNISGAETYVLGLHRSKDNLAVAQKENSVITLEDDYTNRYEGFDPSQPESYIMFELMQNVYLEQSISVASLIQNEFKSSGREDRGVKQAGFLVLRQTSMPSVLVELGYISNAVEEKYLSSDSGAVVYANALYKAVKAYKNIYDKQNNPSIIDVSKNKKIDLWPSGVNYRLQIAASKNELKIDTAKTNLPLSFVVENQTNKYMLGIFNTADEATEAQKKLKNRFPGCFIVAFDGKEKITVKQARKKQTKK